MPGGRNKDRWQLRTFNSVPSNLSRTISTASSSSSSLQSSLSITIDNSSSGFSSNASNRSVTLNPVPYTILRIDNITSRMLLSTILRKVAMVAPNIVGISRTADYKSKRMGITVYLYSVSKIDAVFLEHEFIDYREDGRDPQSMTIVDYKLGRARIMNTSYISRYDCIPVSIVITGLKRYKINEGMTHYLADILTFYEKKGTITSIRFNYDAKNSRSQNNGFVTFLSQTNAKNIANDVTTTEHLIQGSTIKAKLSDGVPMLVKSEHYYLMPTGITVWTKEVEDINVLIIQHRAPMVYPRANKPDRNTGELREHTTLPIGDDTESDSSANESISSIESTKCVKELRGVTVPFELGVPKPVVQVPLSNANVSTASSDEIKPSSPKRQKIIIHEVLKIPDNSFKLVDTPDGQTVVLQEEVELENI